MLTDKAEIQIISKARQKNVRDPSRSREHFNRIFDDFFCEVDFKGRTYLDLGAGQYDFCELARVRGGICDGVDKDPAVLELGRYKGFGVIDTDIKKINSSTFSSKYDGVFNKFSLNAFWFWRDEMRHNEFVVAISELVKPGGWAWIAPWNGVPKNISLSKDDIKFVLNKQQEFFEENGFQCINLTMQQSKMYGVNGAIENNVLFVKNLKWVV